MHGRKLPTRVIGQKAVYKCEWTNTMFWKGHRSYAYGRYQTTPTRNYAMQQVAFECQKLIGAGLHQPAPLSQWPLGVLIQDKGGAP